MPVGGRNVSEASDDRAETELNTSARFTLLASAVSGRRLDVAPGDPGEPAWCDGRTVFIDQEAAHHFQLQCVLVQASLVSAGSFDPKILDRLGRRPATTRRYLSVEGHRALVALRTVLPTAALPLTDLPIARRSDSPQASLHLALGGEEIPAPPADFGAIHPRRIHRRQDDSTGGLGQIRDQAKRRQTLLRELDDGVEEDPAVNFLSSPVGGGGPIGRLLKRLLDDTRSSGSGSPGADPPTRFRGTSNRVSKFGATAPGNLTVSDDGSFGSDAAIRLPRVGRAPSQLQIRLVHSG